MRFSFKSAATVLMLSYFVACAPVKFESMPEPECGSNGVVCEQKCTGPECIQTFTVEKRVGDAMADILIINDNSGSMSFEQNKMAERFPTFIQTLGNTNYRIAMTTTDISSKYTSTPLGIKNNAGPNNGNGNLQDGSLIEFSSGVKYLENSTASKESLFFGAIQRKETDDCEKSGYSQCPSNDERAVFAANLVLDRTASQFMRPLAPLAVIILSDEDARGISDQRSAGRPNESTRSNDLALIRMYPLENYDLPQTFVDRFHAKYPGKALSVHSIIVKPGDTGCLLTQSSQGNYVRGTEGYSYAKLSELTGGIVGSICEADYGAQLANIASAIQEQVTSLAFSCRPIDDKYELTFEPQPAAQVSVAADFDKLELKINEPLPAMTKVKLKYDCVKP